MTYWDTTAIFKLYVWESDSPFFLDLLAQTQEQVTSSVILRLEVLCAARRKEQSGEIKTANSVVRELDQHIEAGKVVLIPYGPNIVAEAEKLLELIAGLTTRRMLRSLDTIHLASALESKATSFVATDIRLREIAALAGLKVLP